MSDGLHACPWPGCAQRVPRYLWGCRAHWYQLPRHLRDECLDAWRSGSMADHGAALDAIDQWLEPSSPKPTVS